MSRSTHLRRLRDTFSSLSWHAPYVSPLVAAGLLIPLDVHASDPCDFASRGTNTFSFEQVTECYEQVPFDQGTLENIVGVIAEHRSLSDLAEIYEERVGWREALDGVLEAGIAGEYPGDFAMHEALKLEHKRFRNAHVAYTPPGCYWRMLTAFMPFDFGSTLLRKNGEQIIFIEATPFLPDLYQTATGIDASAYVGMRVLEINGVPVLDYFRDFGRERMSTHEDDGGHLNGILNQAGYSVRLGDAHDFIPWGSEDEYLLQTRSGRRVRVNMPWVFASADLSLGDAALPLAGSTAEFVDECLEPLELPSDGFMEESFAERLSLADETDRHRRRALERYRRRGHHPWPRAPRERDYHEVPPAQLGKDIQEIIPQTGSARVLQYDNDVTVLRLGNTVGWIDVARAGIDYACDHSRRLIVDLRGNGGGYDTVITWLHRHLFPDASTPRQSGKIVYRLRNDNPVLNEFLYNSALWDALAVPYGSPPCELGFGPGCLMDVDTGELLPWDDLEWFLSPAYVESRGGEEISLTREFSAEYVDDPVFDSAECAGRFVGENLVLLTDGSNASGGYFLPAAFKGDGVIVTMGGYVGEPMAMGRARGGPTVGASSVGIAAALMEELSGGAITFQQRPLLFERRVESNMEAMAAYREDTGSLHVEDPVDKDLRVYVWSDSPETDGFVYGRILRAVDGRPRP